MLSQGNKKLIRKLYQKKYRDKTGLFIIEGEKIVSESLQNSKIKVEKLFFTDSKSPNLLKINPSIEFFEITQEEMKTISRLETPSSLLAIVRQPVAFMGKDIFSDIVLIFDKIQDPGNLGTIIRTADWFGIRYVVCSPDSVDVFNPKVVQASMGAVLRIPVFYLDLPDFLVKAKLLGTPIYGTFLEGENIYDLKNLINKGFFIFGNESKGISPTLKVYIDKKITIPSFSKNQDKAESLNLASSVAIFCSEIKRTS